MKKILSIAAASFILFACSTTKPALSVADATAFPVKGRQGLMIQQKLKFGDYETSVVKRSWTRGRDGNIDLISGQAVDPAYPNLVSMNFSGSGQSFQFRMNDFFGNKANLMAVSNFYSEDLRIGDNPNSVINILEDIFGGSGYSENLFYLQVFVNDEVRPWQLLLDNHSAQMFSDEYTAYFVLDRDHFYTLRPINKVMGKKGPQKILAGAIGYEIFDGSGQPVAAVSLLDRGEVYLYSKNPSEKFLLSSLCAALLLQEDIAGQGI